MPWRKGKAFEFVVEKLLLACRFRPVPDDGLLVYRDGMDRMVQGLGQPHNADVLLAPPVQTPFYFPSRLIVECKCWQGPAGLPVLRNALGLREDVNHFDIVTENILRNRKSARSTGQKVYPIPRFHYQVAVASFNGFTNTVYPFAQAHRIPLISFANESLFRLLRNTINSIEVMAQKSASFGQELSDYLDREWLSICSEPDFRSRQQFDEEQETLYEQVPGYRTEWFDSDEMVNNLLYLIDELRKTVSVGLLEDGTLLFLFLFRNNAGARRELSPYQIFSDLERELWWLVGGNGYYRFELPVESLLQWADFSLYQRDTAEKMNRNMERWMERSRREEDGGDRMNRLDYDFAPKMFIYHNWTEPEPFEVIRLDDTLPRTIQKKFGQWRQG